MLVMVPVKGTSFRKILVPDKWSEQFSPRSDSAEHHV